MSTAVVAYPRLTDSDRLWIESVRARHDPQHGLIRLHFTLVFPTPLPFEPIAAHASTVCASLDPISFVLRQAIAVSDPHGGGGHVFLVPAEGSAEIASLHRQLYDGGICGQLRDGQPFTPHITIGASADFSACVRLARELEAAPRTIDGRIERLDVIAVDGGQITLLSAHELGTLPRGEPMAERLSPPPTARRVS
jgi:2'-5' RNA ligase